MNYYDPDAIKKLTPGNIEAFRDALPITYRAPFQPNHTPLLVCGACREEIADDTFVRLVPMGVLGTAPPDVSLHGKCYDGPRFGYHTFFMKRATEPVSIQDLKLAAERAGWCWDAQEEILSDASSFGAFFDVGNGYNYEPSSIREMTPHERELLLKWLNADTPYRRAGRLSGERGLAWTGEMRIPFQATVSGAFDRYPESGGIRYRVPGLCSENQPEFANGAEAAVGPVDPADRIHGVEPTIAVVEVPRPSFWLRVRNWIGSWR